jgi:hypothetical protein
MEEVDRGTGRTTRLVDKYIQDIFNNPNKFITIEDHYPHNVAHLYLFNRISDRLKIEHGRLNYTWDKNNNQIKLNI